MLALLILLGLLLVPSFARAQDATCGDPPPVADERLKGEIEGRAEILSQLIGDASLSGQIETSRIEIFSKYPDAEESRSNAYFEYQICILIMRDDSLSTTEKINVLKNIKREFAKPMSFSSEFLPRSADLAKRWFEALLAGDIFYLIGSSDVPFLNDSDVLDTRDELDSLFDRISDAHVFREPVKTLSTQAIYVREFRQRFSKGEPHQGIKRVGAKDDDVVVIISQEFNGRIAALFILVRAVEDNLHVAGFWG